MARFNFGFSYRFVKDQMEKRKNTSRTLYWDIDFKVNMSAISRYDQPMNI